MHATDAYPHQASGAPDLDARRAGQGLDVIDVLAPLFSCLTSRSAPCLVWVKTIVRSDCLNSLRCDSGGRSWDQLRVIPVAISVPLLLLPALTLVTFVRFLAFGFVALGVL